MVCSQKFVFRRSLVRIEIGRTGREEHLCAKGWPRRRSPTVICSALTRQGSSVALDALERVLSARPGDAPGIAITQHRPDKLSAMCADRPNGLCAVKVREVRDGDRLERGDATGTHDPVCYRALAVSAGECLKGFDK